MFIWSVTWQTDPVTFKDIHALKQIRGIKRQHEHQKNIYWEGKTSVLCDSVPYFITWIQCVLKFTNSMYRYWKLILIKIYMLQHMYCIFVVSMHHRHTYVYRAWVLFLFWKMEGNLSWSYSCGMSFWFEGGVGWEGRYTYLYKEITIISLKCLVTECIWFLGDFFVTIVSNKTRINKLQAVA